MLWGQFHCAIVLFVPKGQIDRQLALLQGQIPKSVTSWSMFYNFPIGFKFLNCQFPGFLALGETRSEYSREKNEMAGGTLRL